MADKTTIEEMLGRLGRLARMLGSAAPAATADRQGKRAGGGMLSRFWNLARRRNRTADPTGTTAPQASASAATAAPTSPATGRPTPTPPTPSGPMTVLDTAAKMLTEAGAKLSDAADKLAQSTSTAAPAAPPGSPPAATVRPQAPSGSGIGNAVRQAVLRRPARTMAGRATQFAARNWEMVEPIARRVIGERTLGRLAAGARRVGQSAGRGAGRLLARSGLGGAAPVAERVLAGAGRAAGAAIQGGGSATAASASGSAAAGTAATAGTAAGSSAAAGGALAGAAAALGPLAALVLVAMEVARKLGQLRDLVDPRKLSGDPDRGGVAERTLQTVGGPVGALAGRLKGLADALAEATDRLKGWNFQFAEVSAQMASVQAADQVNRTRYDQRMGDRLAGSARTLVESDKARRESTENLRAIAGQVENMATAVANMALAAILQPADQLAGFLNRTAKQVWGDLRGESETPQARDAWAMGADGDRRAEAAQAWADRQLEQLRNQRR